MSENTSTQATATPTASTTSGQIAKGTDAAASYKPATDSSPQWKKAALADGRLHLDISNGACLCGCNQAADRRFRPGHDAALKGKLTRAALHGAKVTLHGGDQAHTLDARQMASKLNTEKHAWDVALDKSVASAKQAAADRAKRAAEAKAKREAAAKERGESTKLDLAAFAI